MQEKRVLGASPNLSGDATTSQSQLAGKGYKQAVAGVVDVRKALELLECPVCYGTLTSPIYQCSEGHTLCYKCLAKVAICPSCRTDQIKIRCRALEGLADSFGEVACHFANIGCRERLRLDVLREHEHKCTFRPLKCPDTSFKCRFEASPEDLIPHLMAYHQCKQKRASRIDFVLGSDIVQPLYEPSRFRSVWFGIMHLCHGQHYIVRVSCYGNESFMLFANVLAIDYEEPATSYEIHLRAHNRRFSYEGPVSSLRKGYEEVERKRDCLALTKDMTDLLVGGQATEHHWKTLKLSISGEIFRDGSSMISRLTRLLFNLPVQFLVGVVLLSVISRFSKSFLITVCCACLYILSSLMARKCK